MTVPPLQVACHVILFGPPPRKIFGFTWKSPLLPPPGKNPSDTHVHNVWLIMDTW